MSEPTKTATAIIAELARVARTSGIHTLSLSDVEGLGAVTITLGSLPPPELVQPSPSPTPIRPMGPAASMAARFHPGAVLTEEQRRQQAAMRAEQHNRVMFAASSIRPRTDIAVTTPESDVPRAVRAKQAVVTRGAKRTKQKR